MTIFSSQNLKLQTWGLCTV